MSGYSLPAQIKNKGIPFIRNYSYKDYKASPQNWSITQDQRGIMFFGNNHGVLEFDGDSWRLTGVVNKTIVRSLAIDKAGRIYVGAQDDFGYLLPDSTGQLFFKSLKSKIEKAYQSFDDVWKIYVTNEGVVFFTYSKIYYLIDDEIKVFLPSSGPFNFPFYVNDRLLLSEPGVGLIELKRDKISVIPNSQEIGSYNITGMFPHSENNILIITDKKGMFLYDGYSTFRPWKTAAQEFLSKNEIYCGAALIDGYALGSTHDGLLIIDKNGVPIQHLNREKGLQNGAILTIYQDNSGNLWLGTNNGIDYIEINSPFTFFNAQNGVPGTAFTSAIYKEKIYLGTNEGLYYQDWSEYENPIHNQAFKPVENADGKINNLQNVKNHLLLAHHKGPYEIINNKAFNLSDHWGVWMFMPLIDNPEYVLCGTYSGLLLYKIVNGKAVFQRKISGFTESSRVMEQDNEGNVWIAHGYKGVFKLKLSESLDKVEKMSFYNSEHGFPSNLFINVFKINNKLVFTGETGIYKYDKASDRFVIHDGFSKYFERDKHIRKLIEDREGNIWFSVGEEMGVLKKRSNGNYEVEKNIFNKLEGRLVGGFEHIAYYDGSNVIIGIDEGFVHYNPSFSTNNNSERAFNALIRKVEITNGPRDSLLFGGTHSESTLISLKQPEKEIYTIPYKYNSIKFNFSSTSYEDINRVQYQYFLEGFDKNWSNWTTATQKEYTNLYEGDYIFHVRARNIYNKESITASYNFNIKPPLARSFFAYVLYSILFLGVLVFFKRLKDRSVRKAKERLKIEQEKTLKLKEAQHMEEVLKAEKEIIKLNNEKLENELSHKNKELTSSAMHVMHSIETIQKIRDQIQSVIETTNDKNTLNHLRKVLKAIETDIKFQNNWEQFELHFNQIHQDFLKRLRDDFPQLTHRDIKLCAYLRLNLSSKEIAPLLNLSIRGIETSRYRIRKKMDLDQDVNLTEFILKY